MAVLEPELFATSTTIALTGTRLSVVKRRLPLTCPESPALAHEARRRAQQATIDEASWLTSARHRSVVELRRVDPDEYLLETAYAGRQSLQTAPVSAEQAVVALRSLAITVSELHDKGLVHGQLALEHLITVGHRPGEVVVCSPGGRERGHHHDVEAVVAIADQLRLALAPRSSAWAATTSDLWAQAPLGDPDILVRAFEELARTRSSALRWVRSLAMSR